MPSFEESLNVFDLPNLRSQPTFELLQRTLQSLELKPTSWDSSKATHSIKFSEPALSRYLTGIISNPLQWFDDSEEDDADAKREILWEMASKRMTERCGRSAMGELNRAWIIPASKFLPELCFALREPPLTGDNLGLKTWGTAFTIAKKLEYFYRHFLTDSLGPDSKVLELGAGTGLVGIAASAIWSTNVILTDLEEIQPNLQHNIMQNIDTVKLYGGSLSGDVLNWKSSNMSAFKPHDFDVIIAADSLYDDDHPELVTNMIVKYLKLSPQAKALVAVPLRDKNTTRMAEVFKCKISDCKLEIIHEGWEDCRDDWEPIGEDGVKCWWALLGWSA